MNANPLYVRSTFACLRCKSRKVKCNEQKPCHHCLRRREQCSYKEDHVIPDQMGALVRPVGQDEWSMELYLMYHYAISTSISLSAIPELQRIFQIDVPRLARTYPMLSSAILAISALHLIELEPENKSQYWYQYQKHETIVLRGLQTHLHSINDANCHVLFLCASLVGLFTLRKLTAVEDVEVMDQWRACQTLAQGYQMIHGVKEVFRDTARKLFSSPFKILLTSVHVQIPDGFCLSKSTSDALQQVQSVINENSTHNDEHLASLNAAFLLLEKSIKEIAFLSKVAKLEPNHLFKFSAMVPETFIELIEVGNDAAVITSTYFSALSGLVKNHWCVGRQFGSISIRLARHILDPSKHHYLDWPEKICNHSSIEL